MGFQESMSRGLGKMSRAADRAKTDMSVSDLAKDRERLVAQLGASLYDVTRNDPKFTTGREQIYAAIADVDAKTGEFQKHLDDLAAQEAAEAAARAVYTCPRCGSPVRATDSFCTGCGMPIADVIAAAGMYAAPAAAQYAGPRCAKCGAPLTEGSAFCMSCGAPVSAAAPAASAAAAAPSATAGPAASAAVAAAPAASAADAAAPAKEDSAS